MRTKIISIFSVILLFALIECSGQQAKPELTLTLFSQGFTRPTDIKNCGDSRIFIVQQTGKITILDSVGNIKPTPFLDITTKVKSTGGEQGLLGLAFSPNYKEDGTFYIHYTNYNGPSGNIVISRFHRSSTNPDLADPTEEKLLEVYHPYTNHNGGDLGFGADGYLYMGFGDGGNGGDPGNRGQSLDTLLGKLLRIDVSKAGAYSIPANNPFIDTPNARSEIWAYGLRNPWRWSFDRLTHDLWIADVGQNLWEEIDFQASNNAGGENYGWKCWEGDVKYSNCDPVGVTFPIYTYNHTAGNCSVTGGYVYRGVTYGDLFGRYIFADYCSGRFMSIRPNGSGGWITDTLTTTPTAPTGDISAFGEDKNGELYLAGNASGKIWKLGSKSCLPTAFITNPNPVLSCGVVDLVALGGDFEGLKYQWRFNDNDILNATNNTYSASLNGEYYVKVTNNSCTSTSQNVSVKTDFCSGISDIINDSYVTVYPIPASTIYYVDINLPKSAAVNFMITDMFGRQLKNFNKLLNGGYNHLQMQLEAIPDGIYFLMIKTEHKNIVRKFVISR